MPHISELLFNSFKNIKSKKDDIEIIKKETENIFGFSLDVGDFSIKKGEIIISIKQGPKKIEAYINKQKLLELLKEKTINTYNKITIK